MHRIIYITCPYCKKMLGGHHDVGERNYIAIGSPIQICPHCHQPFRYSEGKEWINLTQEERNMYLSYRGKGSFIPLPALYLLWLILLGLSIGLTVTQGASGIWYLWVVVGVLTVICFILPFVLHKRRTSHKSLKYDELIMSSLKRCMNPEHLKLLDDCGLEIYDISQEELDANGLDSNVNKVIHVRPETSNKKTSVKKDKKNTITLIK